MGLIASAYARLSQPDAVRVQVLAHLFIARVHNSVKSSYDRYLASSSGQPEWRPHAIGGGQHSPVDGQSGYSEPHAIRPAIAQQPQEQQESTLTQRKRRNNKSAAPDLSHGVSSRTPDDARKWDWRGFPGLWRPLRVYDWISICWMSFASITTIFQEQLSALVDPLSRWLLNGRPGNCLIIGRLARPLGVSEYITVVLASYHLVWRLAQARCKRNRLVTMIVFLLAGEGDLERVYASLNEDGREQFAHPNHRRRHHHHRLLDDRGDEHPSPSRTGQRTRAAPASARTKNERLFRQVMCYQVHRNQRVHFRLRPNRTREARTLLGRRMAAVSIATIIFFGLELVLGLAFGLVCIASDYRYARTYPGCYPLLDARLARGELFYFSSVTMRDHHLVSACVDLLENLIFWVDSAMSLTFTPAFTYMLNYDLLLYWSELNRKLESLARRSKRAHLSQTMLEEDDSHSGDAERMEYVSSSPAPSRLESMRALESDIHEVQFEMFDFFNQIRRADLIVGDTLTHAILIWLSGCALLNCNLLVYKESSLYMFVLIELVFMLGFFVISLATYHLLELRRRCLRSYQTLCTLMAYDRTRKKRTFIKLMDFYQSTRNSATYHLCRTYAYEPTTFITIIGWSFSCFFIAFTLFRPHGSAQPSQGVDHHKS